MIEQFISRIGTFLILIGIGIFVLFIASESAGTANFDYLFWALLAMFAGFFLRRRRESPAPTERFETMRRLRSSKKDRRDRE